MITYKDIKDAFIEQLNDNFDIGNVYEDELQQGFESPAFFVQLIPIQSIRNTRLTKHCTVLVDINYFPKEDDYGVVLNDDLYLMIDGLEDLFKYSIKVKDRFINFKNIEYEIKDSVLHYEITLDYYLQIIQDEQYDLMEDLEVSFKHEREGD